MAVFTQHLTIMAEIWDNQPGGVGLSPSYFQDIHYLPQSTNTFLCKDHHLQSSENLSLPELKGSSTDWCAPTWLYNLCQILDLRLPSQDNLQKAKSDRAKSTSMFQADTEKYQRTEFPIQTHIEATVMYLSTPTEST